MAVILGGKMLGVAGALGALKVFVHFAGAPAGAAPLQEVVSTADDLVNPTNTMWTLIAAFLVFFMQAGFMALEIGFARARATSPTHQPDRGHLAGVASAPFLLVVAALVVAVTLRPEARPPLRSRQGPPTRGPPILRFR